MNPIQVASRDVWKEVIFHLEGRHIRAARHTCVLFRDLCDCWSQGRMQRLKVIFSRWRSKPLQRLLDRWPLHMPSGIYGINVAAEMTLWQYRLLYGPHSRPDVVQKKVFFKRASQRISIYLYLFYTLRGFLDIHAVDNRSLGVKMITNSLGLGCWTLEELHAAQKDPGVVETMEQMAAVFWFLPLYH